MWNWRQLKQDIHDGHDDDLYLKDFQFRLKTSKLEASLYIQSFEAYCQQIFQGQIKSDQDKSWKFILTSSNHKCRLYGTRIIDVHCTSLILSVCRRKAVSYFELLHTVDNSQRRGAYTVSLYQSNLLSICLSTTANNPLISATSPPRVYRGGNLGKVQLFKKKNFFFHHSPIFVSYIFF